MTRWILILSFAVAAWTFAESDQNRQAGEEGIQRRQCWSVTQSGNRCKRRARTNERYCTQHSATVIPTKPLERCCSMTEDGKQCGERPLDGKRYCAKHLEPIAKPSRDEARSSHTCATVARDLHLGRDGLCPVRFRNGFAIASSSENVRGKGRSSENPRYTSRDQTEEYK